MTTRSVETENYECSIVKQPVTVTVLKVTHPIIGPAKQMKRCSKAHVCKLFGAPPLSSAFSSPISVGCPYHDSLNKG